MKILVFTEATITVHPEAAGHTRKEIIQQSLNRDANGVNIDDYKNYILLGNPDKKLRRWKDQGAEIFYLTSRTDPEEIKDVKKTLEKYNLPDTQNLYYRQGEENYSQVAERIMPDVLIEDDCESIGGEAEMTYTHIKPELKSRIKQITVKEFDGIDHLPDDIKKLMNSSKYVFKPYNSIFPNLFSEEKERLKSFLSGNYLIEHIGSTAVPGLGGKGIIDIMIAVPKGKMKDYSAQLEKAGYKYIEQASIEQKLFHWQDLPDPLETFRRYHIHLTYPEGEEWKKAIAFRDYLRNNLEEVTKYADTKIAAVKQNKNTKEDYMAIKEPIIQEILKKALASSF